MLSLLIPIETQWREFDAKLLFACVAAERGHEAFLGSQREIHLRVSNFNPSIYIAKDLRQPRIRIMKILQSLGHQIVAWDEEGVNPNRHRYHRVRLCPDAFQYVTNLFSWGRNWTELCCAYPSYPGTTIHATGNPRIDILRPEVRGYYLPEAQSLREQYGHYVLINTNFGLFNHFVPKLSPLAPQTDRKSANIPNEFDAGLTEHRYALFCKFQEIIPALAKAFPEIPFVVRPHPSENHEPWHKAAKGLKNVHVVFEGNVAPWLLAARGTIQNNCTTSIESHLLGRPVITFQPLKSKLFDLDFPNSLGEQAESLSALTELIPKLPVCDLSENSATIKYNFLSNHIEALEGELASDRIISVIEKLDIPSMKHGRPKTTQLIRGWVEAQVRASNKRIKGLFPGNKNSLGYEAHRFPGLSLEFVRDRIHRLERELDRFQAVKVKEFTKNIFRLAS